MDITHILNPTTMQVHSSKSNSCIYWYNFSECCFLSAHLPAPISIRPLVQRSERSSTCYHLLTDRILFPYSPTYVNVNVNMCIEFVILATCI